MESILEGIEDRKKRFGMVERSSDHLTANTVITHCLLQKDESPAPGPDIFVRVQEKIIEIICASYGNWDNTKERCCRFDLKKCKQEEFDNTEVVSKDEFMQSKKSLNECDTPQQ